jgi:FixJ family two-component response regulator
VAIQAFRLGVKDYFAKRFKVTEIMEAVDRSLTGGRLKREKQELVERIQSVNRQYGSVALLRQQLAQSHQTVPLGV